MIFLFSLLYFGSIFLETSPTLTRNPHWRLGDTQNPLTGYAGLACIVVLAFSAVYMKNNDELNRTLIFDLRKIIGFFSVFLVMAFTEIVFFKVHRRNFEFSLKRELDAAARMRIFFRMVALIVCLTGTGAIFVVATNWFPQFIIFFYVALPLILLLAPVYFYLLERYGRPDAVDDELLNFGRMLFGKGEADRQSRKEHFLNLLRGVGVKGFFIPFMVVSCITFWNYWEMHATVALANLPFTGGDQAHTWSLFFKAFIDLIILIDVTIASLGYLTSCRLLDTQFTSVEPTVSGWVVALICYPPFNILFEAYAWKFASYELTEAIYVSHPALSVFMACAIVILMSIYCWSTVVFGLRFSNLTNRGIIVSGPYRAVRHPAYASKNLSWWLAFICYMLVEQQILWISVLVLLLINVTYLLRGITEERHLMRESHYKEYCERVRFRFIPGVY